MNRTPSDFDTTCKQLWSIEVIIAISMMLGSFSCIARNKSHVLLNNQYSNCFPMLTISCFSKLMVVEFPRSFTETYHQASLKIHCSVQFSSAQLLSHVRLFETSWIAARQASRSITNSRSSFKLMPIKSVMPSSHIILCRPLLLLPPIPSSIRVFSNESTLCMRWPKYWSFSFSIIPSKEHPGLVSFRMDWSPLGWNGWISLQSKGLSRVFSNTTV